MISLIKIVITVISKFNIADEKLMIPSIKDDFFEQSMYFLAIFPKRKHYIL